MSLQQESLDVYPASTTHDDPLSVKHRKLVLAKRRNRQRYRSEPKTQPVQHVGTYDAAEAYPSLPNPARELQLCPSGDPDAPYGKQPLAKHQSILVFEELWARIWRRPEFFAYREKQGFAGHPEQGKEEKRWPLKYERLFFEGDDLPITSSYEAF